jgi:hypothetical protein
MTMEDCGMADDRALTITSLAEDSRPTKLGTRITRMRSEMLADSSLDRDEGRVAETAEAAPAPKE